MAFFKPRKVFLVYFSLVVVFLAAATGARGNAGLACLTLTLAFESICFPTIFTLGIRGLGRHTKFGSTVIVGCISGGALVPPLLGLAADHFNDTGRAMMVPLLFMVTGYVFPILVNVVPGWPELMDGFNQSTMGTSQAKRDIEAVSIEKEKHTVEMVEGLGDEHAATTRTPGL